MKSLRVAIIGGGIGGIAMAYKLKKAGYENVVVLESAEELGGTWYYNRYPGVACDVPSHLYSFSFKMNYDWSTSHGSGQEILNYLHEIVDENGLEPFFRYNWSVAECRWLEDEAQWMLVSESGAEERCDVVISATGVLNHPNIPRIPGMDLFKGPMFHTARWEDQWEFAGKRVAYVGTGSTAAQLVPQLATVASQLFVFQREPGWVFPNHKQVYTAEERARFTQSSWRVRWERFKIFRSFDRLQDVNSIGSEASRKAKEMALGFLEAQVRDPEIRRQLTPTYAIGCKRPVISSAYLASFNNPNVRLVSKAVTEFTETGVITADGREYPVDAIILSTGFVAHEFLGKINIIGPGGVEIKEAWRRHGGAYAYLGMAVPGFPNFFMMQGPNGSTRGSAMLTLERQAGFIVRTINRIPQRGGFVTEARRAFAVRYDRWLQRGFRKNAQAVGGCNNYARDANGRVVTHVPFTAGLYLSLLKLSPRFAFRTFRFSKADYPNTDGNAVP